MSQNFYNKYGIEGYSNSFKINVIRKSNKKNEDLTLTFYPLEDGRVKVKIQDRYLVQFEETTMPINNLYNYVYLFVTSLDRDWEKDDTRFEDVQILAPMFPSILMPVRKLKHYSNQMTIMDMLEQTVYNWKFLCNRYYGKKSGSKQTNQSSSSLSSSLQNSVCEYPKFDGNSLNHCC